MKAITINENQKKIVINILTKNFPSAKFFVFGSRANQKNLKPFSDLDIAIVDTSKIDGAVLNQTREEFSASDLPFKADLIDFQSISPEFKKNIENDLIELTK